MTMPPVRHNIALSVKVQNKNPLGMHQGDFLEKLSLQYGAYSDRMGYINNYIPEVGGTYEYQTFAIYDRD